MKRSTPTLVLVLVLCAAWLAPSIAAAQAPSGIALEALAPEGFVVREVIAPDALDLPVRVVLGTTQGSASHTVDVRVFRSAAAARSALREAAPALASGGVEAAPGIGDEAYAAGARLVAFARLEVMVVVTALGDGDATPLARHAAALVRRSAEADARLVLTLPQPGATATLSLPEGVVAAYATGEGPIAARRSETGWLVTRRAEGGALRVVTVDRSLRARETTVR